MSIYQSAKKGEKTVIEDRRTRKVDRQCKEEEKAERKRGRYDKKRKGPDANKGREFERQSNKYRQSQKKRRNIVNRLLKMNMHFKKRYWSPLNAGQ